MMYDYIIVGSGPAGASAAYCLSLDGAKCIMLEAQQKRKEKICGGLLAWSGIELLNKMELDVSELIAMGSKIIRHFVLVRDGSKEIHSYNENEFALGIQRIRLDNWLVNKAVMCGAEIQYNCRVHDYHINGDICEANSYHSKNIIFACGARGLVLPSQMMSIRNQSFGISAHINGTSKLRDDSVYFWYLNDSNDYFWAISIGNDLWNIGIWFEKPVFPISLSIFEIYKKEYIDAMFDKYCYLLPPRGAFCGNVDLSVNLPDKCFGLGDFAGNNVCTSGEGVRYAIESAFEFVNLRRRG